MQRNVPGHACAATGDDALQAPSADAIRTAHLLAPGAPEHDPCPGRDSRRRGVQQSAQVLDLAPTNHQGQSLAAVPGAAQIDQHETLVGFLGPHEEMLQVEVPMSPTRPVQAAHQQTEVSSKGLLLRECAEGQNLCQGAPTWDFLQQEGTAVLSRGNRQRLGNRDSQ